MQKVVTVKSALVLKNKTDTTLNVKLELPKGTLSNKATLISKVLRHSDRPCSNFKSRLTCMKHWLEWFVAFSSYY